MIRITRFDNLSPATPLTRIVTIILAAAFLHTGLSEIISPVGFDVGFGIPVNSGDDIVYLSVVGARNTALSLLGIFAALTGMRATMSAVIAVIALMAAIDCYVVHSVVGMTNATIKHAAFAALLGALSLWTAYSGNKEPATNE